MANTNLTTRLNPWNWFQSTGNNRNVPMSYFGPLSNFYRDIDHMFENAFNNFGMIPLSPANALRPLMDIEATDDEYRLTVETPGLDEKDLELNLSDNGVLTIRGEKQQQNEDRRRDVSQSSYRRFEQTLTLPEDADREDITARCENGVLTIIIPRREESRRQTRRIDINAEGSNRNREQKGERGGARAGSDYTGSSTGSQEGARRENRENQGGPKKVA